MFVAGFVITGVGLFVLGSLKTLFTSKAWYLSGLETLIVGGFSAAISYVLGILLEDV